MPTTAFSARVLMLVPSVVKRGIEADVAADRHPRMDYYVLAETLRRRGAEVDLVDYTALGGIDRQRDARLALVGYVRRRSVDAIFCNSESIALPLATLLARSRRRPRLIAIGHRISAPKKRMFFERLGAGRAIDTLFLYASAQRRYALETLRLAPEQAPLIAFHADTSFFRASDEPVPDGDRPLVSAAGLEWRDYPTLFKAAVALPAVDFHIAAASPWSKHRDETAGVQLPPNVTVARHDYASLRALYRRSACVAAPLYETDFQAGITSILEAMACAKPVIASRTTGQTDTIDDGVNGVYVPAGDSAALAAAIGSLVSDRTAAQRIGGAARKWVLDHARIEQWADRIASRVVG